MPKKQTKTKYPKELWVEREYVGATDDESMLVIHETAETVDKSCDEVAIYKFDRLAKVKRTVTVE